MELNGERLIPAAQSVTWAALNDPDILKACIAGCETLERTDPDALSAVVAVKIGPVSARFQGNLKITKVRAPDSYTISFDGQGGVAGFGKGAADVSLSPEGGNTRLRYAARAQVGGKMAQVGSRLIDAAAAKIAEDFFTAFEARLRPAAPQAGGEGEVQAGAALNTPTATSTPWPWVAGAAAAVALFIVYLLLR